MIALPTFDSVLVTGSQTIQNDLHVNGNETIDSNLHLNGSQTIMGSLNVNGSESILGHLGVTGEISGAGTIRAATRLIATNQATLPLRRSYQPATGSILFCRCCRSDGSRAEGHRWK